MARPRGLLRNASTSAIPLCTALAMHAAVAVALWRRPIAPTTHERPRAPEEATVEVSVETAPTVAMDRTAEPVPPKVAALGPGALGAATGTARAKRDGVPGESTAEAATALEGGPTAAPSGSSWYGPVAMPDLRLNPAGVPSGIPAAEELPARVSATGGLAEGLDAADAAHGLGRGGPVRSAVEEAVRGPDAPIFGVATFAVAIRADGSVQVDLANVSGDHKGWGRATSRDSGDGA